MYQLSGLGSGHVKSVKNGSHVEIECEKSVRVKGVIANKDGGPQLTQESEKVGLH